MSDYAENGISKDYPKKSITQAEFDKLFAEYTKGKTLHADNVLGYLVEFTKKLKEQNITVKP